MARRKDSLAKFLEVRKVAGKTEVHLTGLTGDGLILFSSTPRKARKFRRSVVRILDSVARLRKAGRTA